MNRRTIVACAAMMSALAATALESRQLEVEEGHSETVDLGFAPSGYKQQSGSEFVSVMLAPGASVATVTGVKEGGRSQIEFPDPSGEGVLLTVEVVSDLQKTLIRLRRMLSDFDGLQFSKGSSKILIDGTIGNPTDWAKFNRILKISDFKDKTESIVEFSVDPGTIGALRKEFEAAGFNLAAPGANPEAGQLALKYEHNVLTVSGDLWAKEDAAKALAILKRQNWLKVVSESTADAASNPIAQAVLALRIDNSLLEMGVAFLKISKTSFKSAESAAENTMKAFWGGLHNIVLMGGTRGHQNGKWNDFSIDVGLDHTIQLLAGNSVAREKQYGTIRFHANGDPDKTLHLGGTLKVTPPASGEGEAPEPQDYEYGLKIINKNSRMVSENMAEADFVIEIKGEPYADDRGILGTTVKQEVKTVQPTVRVPLGKTVAVAGYEKLLETTENRGQPFLRHVPIIGWFVSDRAEDLDDSTLLFLVSIRKVDVENEAPMVENTPMKDISVEVKKSNDERIKDEEKARRENGKYRGCWSPLNWFRW